MYEMTEMNNKHFFPSSSIDVWYPRIDTFFASISFLSMRFVSLAQTLLHGGAVHREWHGLHCRGFHRLSCAALVYIFFVSEGMQIQNPQKQAVLGSRKIIVKSAS